MPNDYFQFKQFTIFQDRTPMKVCTDSCILGALAADWMAAAKDPVETVLDIGGGTGLLSLMIAQKNAANIFAIELNENAAAQMQENFSRSPWPDRLNGIQGDALMLGDRQFDFIISNPPFYENDLHSPDIQASLARHNKGLTLADLTAAIQRLLSPAGRFCIMIPSFRYEYFRTILYAQQLCADRLIHVQHSARHKPFRTIVFGKKGQAQAPREEKLLIRTESGAYSEEFNVLLRDYYLKL